MTQNKRIILNTLATSARSIYALVLGVFAGRWAVEALGQIDYGLRGVVGGISVFITFINSWLSSSISRFYAVSIGKVSILGKSSGLDESRRWFNIAIFIHTVVPLVLVIVGYPIGVWVIKHWLVIPIERIAACIWVFRFTCIACFVGMINVPFMAMYTAKQYIAELTVYSFASSTLNVCFLYVMITHPGDWLVRYSLWYCLLSIVPNLIICFRALHIFPECKINVNYLIDFPRLKKLLNFAGWQFFSALGWMLQSQGMMLIVNKFFGPRINASMNLANTVNSQAGALSSAMTGAFLPAITTAYGSGNIDLMRKMAFRASKFGSVLLLILVLPLSMEINEVVNLWLKTPPPHTAGLCLCMMFTLMVGTLSVGHMSAILANGRIASYQLVTGSMTLSIVPLAIIVAYAGLGIYSVVLVATAVLSMHTVVRVLFARRLVEMSFRYWLFRIVIPILLASALSASVGSVSIFMFPPSVVRIVLTTVLTEIVLLPCIWIFIFDADERTYAKAVLKSRIVQLGFMSK